MYEERTPDYNKKKDTDKCQIQKSVYQSNTFSFIGLDQQQRHFLTIWQSK